MEAPSTSSLSTRVSIPSTPVMTGEMRSYTCIMRTVGGVRRRRCVGASLVLLASWWRLWLGWDWFFETSLSSTLRINTEMRYLWFDCLPMSATIAKPLDSQNPFTAAARGGSHGPGSWAAAIWAHHYLGLKQFEAGSTGNSRLSPSYQRLIVTRVMN